MTQPKVIDTHMHGRPGITAAFLIQGEQTALVETGPQTSLGPVLEGLTGVDRLDWIIVTHIHLDHAGAAGDLARKFPEAKVAVHEVGAPHLADPTKLWSSATRIYGDDMERLWGGMEPIPEDRIHVLRDGDKIDLGGRSLQAIDTPGHAGHHHSFLDSATGIIFTGDALGVRLPEVGLMRPATPPPEFNLDLAIDSINRIRSIGATATWLTHFGSSTAGATPMSVDETCDAAIEALTRWAQWVEDARTTTSDIDEVTVQVRRAAEEAFAGGVDPQSVERMEQTTSYRMNVSGYMRYFDKKDAGKA